MSSAAVDMGLEVVGSHRIAENAYVGSFDLNSLRRSAAAYIAGECLLVASCRRGRFREYYTVCWCHSPVISHDTRRHELLLSG